MSVEDFYDMIPKHFFNKLNGFFDLEQIRERNEWERCRWQTCYLLNIQIVKGKKLKLTDLIEFDWDKKKKEVDFEQLKNKAEYIKKLSEHGS
jgi:nucleoside-specific outer membrane channel protein Tsx